MADPQTTVEAGESRYDFIGPLRAMAIHGNWVMCRRPRAVPWVLSMKDWLKLSVTADCVGKSSAPRAMHYGVRDSQTTVGDVCSQCAEEAGGVWPDGHVATMSVGKCDVCYLDRAVCSPGDWNWPKGRPKRWLGGRD